jgi:hypothetical protein
MEFAKEIREFLIESNENLGVQDREIVEVEKSPADAVGCGWTLVGVTLRQVRYS